jgi:ankyrin repeat protein
MGTWGIKTFENDGTCDWLYDLEESTSAEFLLKPLREVIGTRGKADLDASLEALAAAEVIAAARYEPPKSLPPEARKWIRRIGFSPDDKLIRVACQAIEKVKARSELADEWGATKDSKAWNAEVTRLIRRLKLASGNARPIRKPQPSVQRQTLAELIIEVSKTRSATLRAELNSKLSKLKNLNREIGGKGLNSLTPLHWLAASGLVPEARALIQRGAKMDVEISCMARPIGFAIENSRRPMIRCLLELGADVNYAFQYAVKRNRPSLVQLIYGHGVDLQAKGTMGRTVSHSAAYSSADRSLELLSKLGADLETKDENSETPLHYAAMFGKLRAVKKLLELKVNVNPVNGQGRTPLDFAMEDGYSSVVRCLRQHGGRSGSSLRD